MKLSRFTSKGEADSEILATGASEEMARAETSHTGPPFARPLV
jgi:hypothetical protein